MILEDVTNLGKKAGLQSFEMLKDIYLHPDHFTIEAGLMTPTMKLKRPAMKEAFKAQIEKMYRSLD